MMDSDIIPIDNSSTDNNQINHTPIVGEDYYNILGVSKDATERHISSAYKKLSLKYHPDRNEGEEETIKLYHLVTEAYSTLIDPLKRSEYDKKINNINNEINDESYDNSYANISIGKVFGNVLSKFKFSDNHSIQSLIDTAINIAKDGSLESNGGPPINPRLVDLPFGWPSEGKVDRIQANYYRITLDEQIIRNGFIIYSKNINKGKLHLVLINKLGEILVNTSNQSDIELYYTKFPTYSLNNNISNDNNNLPKEIILLDNFNESNQSIEVGQYLLCLYGDNHIGKSHFSLIAALANNNTNEINEIVDIDKSLVESKLALNNLKSEYLKTKYEYETALKKINTESDRVNDLLIKRNLVYRSFVDKSTNAYDPNDGGLNQPKVQINLLNSLSAAAYATASSIRESVFVPSKDTHKNEDESISNETSSIDNSKSSINILSNATKFGVVAATAAVDTASVATGWLRRRLSGFQSKQDSEVVETSVDNTTLPNNADTLTEEKKVEVQSPIEVVVDQTVQGSE